MNSETVINTIKRVLKNRRITYKQLAPQIGITEAGVKKMFLSGDITLSRLIKICDILGLNMEEVLEASTKRPISVLEFNSHQQEFFSKNPRYLYYFLRLLFERRDPNEMGQRYGLTERSVFKYLKKLDDLGLIRLHEGNRVEFLHSAPIAIDWENPFFKRLKIDLSKGFLEKLYHSQVASSDMTLAQFALSKENFEKFKAELIELRKNYQRQAVVDVTMLENTDIVECSYLFAFGTESFIPDPENIED
jgi:DNA-binding Xre family transcriptional regulator